MARRPRPPRSRTAEVLPASLNITDELDGLVAGLLDAGVDFAICGGIAVTVLSVPRFTKDIDLLVPGRALDAALAVARERSFVFEARPMTFDRGTPRERTVRRVTKLRGKASLTLDLVLVEPAFGAVWDSRVEVEWRGRRIPVVSREGLAFMKRIAGRRQDRADLVLLGMEKDDGPET